MFPTRDVVCTQDIYQFVHIPARETKDVRGLARNEEAVGAAAGKELSVSSAHSAGLWCRCDG